MVLWCLLFHPFDEHCCLPEYSGCQSNNYSSEVNVPASSGVLDPYAAAGYAWTDPISTDCPQHLGIAWSSRICCFTCKTRAKALDCIWACKHPYGTSDRWLIGKVERWEDTYRLKVDRRGYPSVCQSEMNVFQEQYRRCRELGVGLRQKRDYIKLLLWRSWRLFGPVGGTRWGLVVGLMTEHTLQRHSRRFCGRGQDVWPGGEILFPCPLWVRNSCRFNTNASGSSEPRCCEN